MLYTPFYNSYPPAESSLLKNQSEVVKKLGRASCTSKPRRASRVRVKEIGPP